MNWTKCCAGRRSCPEIALEGDNVHIKDDYGAEVVLKRDNTLFEMADEMEGNELTIYGEGKKPVRLTLGQFYDLLTTLDSLENQ